MAEVDREAQCKRTCPSAADRLVYDPALSSNPIEKIALGIAFVHAFWAGQSQQTLRALGDSLQQTDPDCRVELIVSDIDEIQQLPDWQSRFYLGDQTSGAGDVLWIANGVVWARHNASTQRDFDTTTQRLLSDVRPD